jgi:hypothetical protein
MRLLIADLVGEAATREGLATLRNDVAGLLARLDETRATAQTLPHRRKYLLLINDLVGHSHTHFDERSDPCRDLPEDAASRRV